MRSANGLLRGEKPDGIHANIEVSFSVGSRNMWKPLGSQASLLRGRPDRTADGNFTALDLSRRLLTPIVAGSFRLAAGNCPGFILKKIERPPVVPLQKIHSLGRGEFAGAARAVALGIIALGTGHRRREGFLQPLLGRFHGSRRRL